MADRIFIFWTGLFAAIFSWFVAGIDDASRFSYSICKTAEFQNIDFGDRTFSSNGKYRLRTDVINRYYQHPHYRQRRVCLHSRQSPQPPPHPPVKLGFWELVQLYMFHNWWLAVHQKCRIIAKTRQG